MEKPRADQVAVPIKCEDAFGSHDPGLTFTDDIENSPQELRYVGAELEAENESGEVLHFRVTHVSDDKITIDANHPLAGQDLDFTVTITEVLEPSAEQASQEFGPH